MLLDQIKSQSSDALKKGDRVRVDTLRFLIAAVRNVAIDKYGNKGEEAMTDEDVLEVIKKQVKTHRESVEAFIKAGRTELADNEKAQLGILESYLPKQISDEALASLLTPVIATGEKNFGLLMRLAMQAAKGQADGARVSALLKQLINQ